MQVFDFDKTLTSKDTLAGFYKAVTNNRVIYSFKRTLLIAVAILYKLKFIDNTRLKKLGVWIFLNGVDKGEINNAALRYGESIILNDVYYKRFLELSKNDRCIISASFEEYLNVIFPDELVFGSKLEYSNGKVIGLFLNMYAENKIGPLHDLGIKSIEALYTDSMTDKPLMSISNKIYIVSNGRIVLQNG